MTYFLVSGSVPCALFTMQLAQGFTDLKAYPDHLDNTPLVLPRIPSSSLDRIVCNARQ